MCVRVCLQVFIKHDVTGHKCVHLAFNLLVLEYMCVYVFAGHRITLTCIGIVLSKLEQTSSSLCYLTFLSPALYLAGTIRNNLFR